MEMINNLHLCEKLAGCPEGTKLWSPLFGVCAFLGLSTDLDEEPEENKFWVYNDELGKVTFMDDGSFFSSSEECLIFPSKDNRDWSTFKVPVKRFDPKTLKPFDKVLERDDVFDNWDAALFSHIDPDDEYPCHNIGGIASYVIPYNSDTATLLGTTDEAPEYYRWWEDAR